MRVTVLFAPAPRQVREIDLELVEGCTVRDALRAAGLLAHAPPELPAWACAAGVWGRKAPLDQPLREHDRVELYRALTVDPKVARRERFRKQGSRASGLFAQRRQGAKPGY